MIEFYQVAYSNEVKYIYPNLNWIAFVDFDSIPLIFCKSQK